MTSALLAGRPAVEKKAAPATPAPVASSCASDCDCPGFGHRFHGLFKRDCDSCKPAKCEVACKPKCERAPLFSCGCKEACAPKYWKWEPKCREPKCHAPKCHEPKCCAPKACAPATCDSCERQGFLAKLRERFHRDRCCDSGCSAPAAVPAKKIEKIDTPPKKLDKGKTEEVQFESRSTPNVI